ncbi:hypothetical protein PLICRDRAFT_325621 [Plicaturopsis crispa FD-325 SS-3]|nr:hypothetical protein PLICRDRAFT_325621 [Plicaturopsis crispa FD-325 SS-3]
MKSLRHVTIYCGKWKVTCALRLSSRSRSACRWRCSRPRGFFSSFSSNTRQVLTGDNCARIVVGTAVAEYNVTTYKLLAPCRARPVRAIMIAYETVSRLSCQTNVRSSARNVDLFYYRHLVLRMILMRKSMPPTMKWRSCVNMHRGISIKDPQLFVT